MNTRLLRQPLQSSFDSNLTSIQIILHVISRGIFHVTLVLKAIQCPQGQSSLLSLGFPHIGAKYFCSSSLTLTPSPYHPPIQPNPPSFIWGIDHLPCHPWPCGPVPRTFFPPPLHPFFGQSCPWLNEDTGRISDGLK